LSKIDPLERPSYIFLTETEATLAALARFGLEGIVGLDTETYWDTALNHSRVSLVQIASPAGEILVVDVLAVGVELLRPLVESPAMMMTAHNARFDEAMLKGSGLRPVAFVDTLRLAHAALRLPSYSLAGVAAHLFGIELDKSYQKSNWRRRPLTRAQLEYAAKDAIVTLRIYEELSRILSEQGRFDEALRAATLRPSSDEPRATRKRRPPAAPLRPLTKDERQALKKLKGWRLEKSNLARVPAYMICPDRTLEELVIEKPVTLEALNSIHGLGASRIERYGQELLDALREALS
jgi:ribonuclease D